MTYRFRVVDNRTGKQLGSSPELLSPYEAGRMAADAYVVLIGRDGHDLADLALEGIAVDGGDVRSLNPAEEAAMVAALDQFRRSSHEQPRGDRLRALRTGRADHG